MSIDLKYRVPTVAVHTDMFNAVTKSVARVNGAPIALRQREFDLLVYLAARVDTVVSRADLLDHVWGYNFDSFSNVVDIYVHYLRNKIDRDFPEPMIKTVRGVGYTLKAA